jgi:hypothetical protein
MIMNEDLIGHGDVNERSGNASIAIVKESGSSKVDGKGGTPVESNDKMPRTEAPGPFMASDRSTASDAGTGYTALKVGDTDPQMGVKIKEIIFVNESCIVYIDEQLTLQWYWRLPLPLESATIFNRAADLEARAQFLRHQKQEEDLLSAIRLIGEGVFELFSTGDPTYANAAMDTADKFISQRSREVSRGWYFGPFLGFFLISIIALLLLYFLDPTLSKTAIFACIFAGGVGAFVSRALASDNTPIAATAGKTLHWIEAILRWCIGLTAGLVIWLLVTGNIAVSFLNASGAPNTFALVSIALLAGASERLLPSLLRSFDDSINKKDTSSQSKSSSSS